MPAVIRAPLELLLPAEDEGPCIADSSPVTLERLLAALDPDGVVVWVAQCGEPPVRVPGGFETTRFLARGRALWRAEAAWVRKPASASKLDLVRSLVGLKERPSHEIQLVARGKGLARVRISRLLGRITPAIADGVGDPRLGRLDRTGTGLVIGQIRTPQGSSLALKIAEGAELRERLAHDTRVVEQLSRSLSPSLALALPRVVAAGEHDGATYRAESWVEGVPAARLMYRVQARERAVDAALVWIGELHAATRRPGRSPASFGEQAVEVLRRVGAPFGGDAVSFADAVGAYVGERLGRHVVPGVQGHGDFWLGNVISAPDGGVSGVLDWDLADEHAPPLEDVLHLLVYRKGPFGAYDPGSRLADLLRGQSSAADRRRLCDYAQRMQLDADVLGALVLVYWVRYLATRASFLRGLRGGYARAYLPVRRVVEGRLGAGLDAIGRKLAAV